MDFKLVPVTGVTRPLAVTTLVDSNETASRYSITLTYDEGRGLYCLAIPNFGVSLESTDPENSEYKLVERGITSVDSQAIIEVVKHMLLPQLLEQVGESE